MIDSEPAGAPTGPCGSGTIHTVRGTMADAAPRIADHRFFSGMCVQHLDLLRRVVHHERFADGERLFEQGDPASVAYFVVQGRVSVRAVGPCGTTLHLAGLGAGDVLGELSLIEDHRRSAAAVAEGPLDVPTIDRSDLAALCAHNHPVSLQLLHRLALLLAVRSVRATRIPPAARSTARPAPAEPWARTSREPTSTTPRSSPSSPSSAASPHGTSKTSWAVPGLDPAPRPVDHRPRRWAWQRLRGRPGAAEALVHRGDQSFRYAVLGPGALFGELAWLLDQPRSAEVRAARPAPY